MIQYINVEEFKKHNLRFCDPKRIRFGLNASHNGWDTGACLYADVIDKNINFKTIKMSDYIKHVGGSSWEQICYGYDNIKNKKLTKMDMLKKEFFNYPIAKDC